MATIMIASQFINNCREARAVMRTASRVTAAALGGLMLLTVCGWAAADDGFIRLQHDDQGELSALQVSIARYADPNGLQVDLISAVHVGDAEYFEDLNRRFVDYDMVLYELVTNDPDADRQTASPAFSMIGFMQGGMKNALDLAFQLDVIDYDPPNFVHADMTIAEFQQSMQDRGESMFGTFLRAWSVAIAQQGQPQAQPPPNMLSLLFAEDRQRALKEIMAEQLANPGQIELLFNNEDGSTLITGRNDKALQVMEAQIAAGHRKLAILYGAGHMPDFERRLLDEYDMTLIEREWLTAWDLATN